MSEITNASLTTDIVLFGEHAGVLHVLLILRGWEPYAGRWALPGGYVDDGERFIEAAARESYEETAVAPRRLVQTGVYDTPDRDPRGRVISVAFAASYDHLPTAVAGSDARQTRWWPLHDANALRLAFDHNQILRDASASL